MIFSLILPAFVHFIECNQKTENKVIIFIFNAGQSGIELFGGTFSVSLKQKTYSSI